jgi:NADP-dependent 3-hydroxy acid dehydrogenase YdfG
MSYGTPDSLGTVDVCVIGAGIIGAATAYHLSLLGAHVTVIDATVVPRGASAATFGWINANGKQPDHYFELNRAGMAEHAELARELGDGHLAASLDVTDGESARAFVETAAHEFGGRIDILVNNAGLALGRTAIAEGSDEDDAVMWETNVLGLVRITRLVLPHMEDGRGHVVNLGSWAGREAYTFGGMYVGSKYAVRALTYVLRKELVGRIRVSTIDPGMVGGTEFSDVRFRGDEERKRAVYEGVRYLTPEDVADCILWTVTRPAHVNVDEIVVKPLQQASQDQIVRST